ncbi:hypothetical protein D9C73_028383 [Collichthys lucidus]|uniref:Uncharacterized protein n=1 Tax=Collichthys lucidus TaxID=240159 RepID=A0A4U5TX20_COLLU|nr:hypothetical protein D9C73_028383 [Collichthys lucidus]
MIGGSIPGSSGLHVEVSLGKTLSPKLLPKTALRFEDGEIDSSLPVRKERRKMAASDLEGRKSRRVSSQNLPDLLSSSAGSSPSTSPTPPTFLSPSTTNKPLSPAISSASSPSPTAGLGSRASSPLPSDLGSPASSPPGSQRGSPVLPLTAPMVPRPRIWRPRRRPARKFSAIMEPRSRSFLSHHMSSLGLSRRSRLFSKASSISEDPPACRSVPDQHRPAQTNSDQLRPTQTSTDQHRPTQTFRLIDY